MCLPNFLRKKNKGPAPNAHVQPAPFPLMASATQPAYSNPRPVDTKPRHVALHPPDYYKKPARRTGGYSGSGTAGGSGYSGGGGYSGGYGGYSGDSGGGGCSSGGGGGDGGGGGGGGGGDGGGC